MATLKLILKALLRAIAFGLVAVPAALGAFGRVPAVFVFFGQALSLVPGLPGNYLRTAYYALTLTDCSLDSRISFGSFLSKRDCSIEKGVYIGSWCNFGLCSIGARTQIADGVQILSGRNQHARGAEGEILGSAHGNFSRVSIGSDCWIGAGAIVMENVGPGSTVGAGSVVTRPVPSGTVVAGNPARPLNSASATLSAGGESAVRS